MKAKPITLAIDFDETIQSRKTAAPGQVFGKPIPGALEALDDLESEGYRIVIHSCVAHTPAGYKAIAEWLDDHEATYHEITAVKPVAAVYLDDKSLRFTDWDTAMNDILRLTGKSDD